jgi:hypothetical protein
MIDEYVVSWQSNQGHFGIQILEATQAIVVVIFKSSFHVIIAKDISEDLVGECYSNSTHSRHCG